MRPEDNVIVRGENTEDTKERSLIHSINEAAFGRPDEADLVDSLRTTGVVLVSLVLLCEFEVEEYPEDFLDGCSVVVDVVVRDADGCSFVDEFVA